MISLKEYAKKNHITYEAVRAQVKRYRAELDDHIIQDGRTQYLDDVAVAFLDERRQKNPVVVYQQSKDETIEAMRQELEGAYKKIATQADRIAELQQFKIETMERRQELEDARTAQERRSQELLQREAAMDEEVRAAVQAATIAAEQEKQLLEDFVADAKAEIAALSAEKADAEAKTLEVTQAAQRAQDELTASQTRELALKEYLAALDAWNSLSWIKRQNKKKFPKPAAPEWFKEEIK